MSETEQKKPRYSDPTLLLLKRLHSVMRANASEAERDEWWSLVNRIESCIDDDARATKFERNAMRRVRDSVSEVYGSLNNGQRPDYSAVTRAITGLQILLETRTIGLDGWPLR